MPGFEPRHGGDISQIGRQRIPDRWSDEAERALTKKISNYVSEFSKTCRLTIRCVKFGTRRAKLEGKRDIITCVYFSVYRCKNGGKDVGSGKVSFTSSVLPLLARRCVQVNLHLHLH